MIVNFREFVRLEKINADVIIILIIIKIYYLNIDHKDH